MPTTDYDGNPFPAAGSNSPSPAPSPTATPKLRVPADDTPNTAANLYVQQYKTLADYLASIQQALHPCAPGTPTSNWGFSAVTQVGGGVGTVTPFGAGYGGQNFVVKIILGGAVGVATYQYSSDGGSTYSGTLTTAATVSLTAGVSVAFSGTFTAATTYQFKCVWSPIAKFTDHVGNGRTIIDHNGFLGGQVSTVEEQWAVAASGATTDPMASYAHSRFTRSGSQPTYTIDALGELTIATGATNTNTDYAYVYRNQRMVPARAAGTACVARFEVEVAVSAAGASGLDYYVGLFSGALADGGDRAAFKLASGGGAVWQGITSVGSVSPPTTTVSSTVVGAAATYVRLMIEVYGPAAAIPTALGLSNGLVVFHINDAIIGASSTNIPLFNGGPSLSPLFGFKCASANLNQNIKVQPYTLRTNRVASAVV